MRNVYWFFFFLMGYFNLQGQKPLLRNYQVKDGLPSSEVYDALQDVNGYMWFATDAGVSRFDGYRFENFTTENGLSDNTVLGMYEDRKGRIWFRTLSGRLCYYLDHSIFTIGANKYIDTINRAPMIASIYVDKGDTLWCGLTGGIITHFKVLPGFEKLQLSDQPGNRVFLWQIDNEGYVWGGFSHGGRPSVIHFIMKDGLRHIQDTIHGGIVQAKHLPSGEWLLVSEARELVSTHKSTAAETFRDVNTCAVEKDRSGNIWIGTLRNGAFFIPVKRSAGTTLRYLDGYSVTAIREDREGGIWLTTLENGVYYLPNRDVWAFTGESGITNNKILALNVSDDNKVWMGSDNGKVSLLEHDHVSREFNIIPSIRTRVNKIMPCAPDKLLICSAPSYLINTRTGAVKLIKYDTKAKPGLSMYLRCFATDADGYGWCANHWNLMKLNKTFDSITFSRFSPGRANVICINKENFWVGCFNGLWKYENDSFVYYGAKNPLLKSRIEDIKILSDGQIWLATRGRGIVVMHQGRIRQLSAKSGLASNIVRSLLVDSGQQVIWAGTNNGISRITWTERQEYNIQNFSGKNDLLFREVNELAMSKDFIWAATNQGLLKLNKDEIFENKIAPPVYIRSMAIDNNLIPLAEYYRFKHYQNIIGISFIGLSYKTAGKLTYKYKLEGLDTVWNHTSNTFVQYTTLPPGNYTFKVFAINHDGIESRFPAQTHLVIESPFWRTWLFIVSMTTTSFLLVILLFHTRLKKLKRKEAEKTALNKRISGIELKALRAQMNPHFIFNSINSIQHFILKNNVDNAHKYLSKFSRLIRNVLENSKYESISIEQELETLKLYIELESLRFSYAFEYEILGGRSMSGFAIPSMVIQPFVENAIWHGLMPKEKPGKLLIQLYKGKDTLKCLIDDDGIGRVKSNDYKTKYHRSMGLSVTRERLEIINHLQQIRYDFKIIDKYENGEATGTRIELHLPVLPLNPENYA